MAGCQRRASRQGCGGRRLGVGTVAFAAPSRKQITFGPCHGFGRYSGPSRSRSISVTSSSDSWSGDSVLSGGAGHHLVLGTFRVSISGHKADGKRWWGCHRFLRWGHAGPLIESSLVLCLGSGNGPTASVAQRHMVLGKIPLCDIERYFGQNILNNPALCGTLLLMALAVAGRRWRVLLVVARWPKVVLFQRSWTPPGGGRVASTLLSGAATNGRVSMQAADRMRSDVLALLTRNSEPDGGR